MLAAEQEQARRLQPRIVDTDWLVLGGLRRAVAAAVDVVAKPGATAIDFGCGVQPYASIITDAGMNYLGADFGPGSEIAIDATGGLGAPDASADLVLSFQVLEHVRDLDHYFSEVRRVLRPGGWMLLSTHGTWLYHPHPEDHRRWTREGLITQIAKGGFETVECTPVVGPLAWTTIVRLTCFCYALRKVPAVGRLVGGFLAVVMNLRAMVEDAITPQWVTRDNACVYLALCRRSS